VSPGLVVELDNDHCPSRKSGSSTCNIMYKNIFPGVIPIPLISKLTKMCGHILNGRKKGERGCEGTKCAGDKTKQQMSLMS